MSTSLTPNVVANPLSDFNKIGHNTYLYTPYSYTPKEPLILIFSWNAAAAKHIAKYTVAYQKLFPTARLVLIRCFTSDVFRLSSAHVRLRRAAETAIEHVREGGEALVHSFSNGGGTQLIAFAKAWKNLDGGKLPMRAQIIDSAPGKGDWRRSHAAIVASLPRSWLWMFIGSAVVHLVLLLTFIVDTFLGRENIMVTMCRQMNSLELFDVGAPRVYLYSEADEMVGWEEVEEHAGEAEALGRRVTRVRFENSAHAGHMREDEGKYWGAVLEAWKQAARP